MLAGAQAGSISRDAVEALVAAVLDADDVTRLALEVRAGGVHAVRRAIELAALVLSSKLGAAPEAATPR